MPEYAESKELLKLFRDVLKHSGDSLAQARGIKYLVVLTDQETDHWAGKTSVVEGAIRFKTGFQFTIKIVADEFQSSNDPQKVKIVIHELNHIDFNEKGSPKIRRHEGDFCEIPEHDKFSETIYQEIKDQIHVPTFFFEKTKQKGTGSQLESVIDPETKLIVYKKFQPERYLEIVKMKEEYESD